MKQFFNISALVLVLSVPFALSSQTRKAIPAGRYEALSGVKNSRSSKAPVVVDATALKTDSAALVWNEALKHLPEGGGEISYFSKSEVDPIWASLFTTKGLTPSSNITTSTQIVFSDNLKRDLQLMKSLKRGKIVILKDKQPLNEIIAPLNRYEILAYQLAEESNHLYLLKMK